ncbi:MAG: ISAs1 family transposase [Anaerolineae bacterium]|nr:ISAs1 family transposase [Anaerolineae bacterium]
MAQLAQLTRRIAGLLRSRLPEVHLEQVAEPRSRRGRRWKHLSVLLRAVLVGLMAGCKSLADVEALTDEMSVAMRWMLGIPRRVPDTTLRHTLIKLDPYELLQRLHVHTKAAHRRKALTPLGLPFGQVAVDGRSTALPDVKPDQVPEGSDGDWAEQFAQRHTQPDGSSYRLMRTMTCTLVSVRAKPCIDAVPIPACTNEIGHFATVVRGLLKVYKHSRLFQLISADAGNCSEANARLVVHELHLDYLFRLKADQPTLLAEAERLLGGLRARQAVAETVDVVGNTTETRRLFITDEMACFLDWEHLQTTIRIRKEKHDIQTGKLLEKEDHYAISSLAIDALSPAQWLYAFRAHWGVENQCHNTWDTAFKEDDNPWIEADPKGMFSVLLLRRLAYNLLALYRSVTQRSEEKRQTPWKTVIRWVYNTLIAAQVADLVGLRQRKVAIAGI